MLDEALRAYEQALAIEPRDFDEFQADLQGQCLL